MSALLDSLAAGFDGDAAAPRRARCRRCATACRARAAKRWKYTSLRALERRSVRAAATSRRSIRSRAARRTSRRRGWCSSTASTMPRIPTSHALPDGVELRRCRRRCDGDPRGPIRSQRRSIAPTRCSPASTPRWPATAWCCASSRGRRASRRRCTWCSSARRPAPTWPGTCATSSNCGDGASLTLVEHHLASGEHRHLGNASLHVRLGARRAAAPCAHAGRRRRRDAVRAHRCRARERRATTGASTSNSAPRCRATNSTCACEGAGAQLVGQRRAARRPASATSTPAWASNTSAATPRCDLPWRGLAAGRGRAVFHGGITDPRRRRRQRRQPVEQEPAAVGDDAEIDTQPVLEIHADEVKAAHGATVGQLDPTAMFYLRSRGLPEADARRLLTAAFCREPLPASIDAALRDAAGGALDRALASLVSRMNDRARTHGVAPSTGRACAPTSRCSRARSTASRWSISIPPTPGRSRRR